VAVEATQAGETVSCTCGKVLTVPALRLVRQFPIADMDTARPRRPRRSWTRTRRLLFAAGLALLFGGAATAIYNQALRTRLVTEEFSWDVLDEAHASIDGSSPTETFEFWKVFRESEIGPYSPPLFVVHRLISAHLRRYVVAGLSVAGMGLFVMLVALVARGRAQPRPVRTQPSA
jgi:hypothetical protein